MEKNEKQAKQLHFHYGGYDDDHSKNHGSLIKIMEIRAPLRASSKNGPSVRFGFLSISQLRENMPSALCFLTQSLPRNSQFSLRPRKISPQRQSRCLGCGEFASAFLFFRETSKHRAGERFGRPHSPPNLEFQAQKSLQKRYQNPYSPPNILFLKKLSSWGGK